MNSTSDFIDWGDYDFSTRIPIFKCSILCVTTILLLTLNPLCLLVLRRVDSIQDTTKVFLRALTAADLGVGIFFALPMTFAAFYQDWPFGDALCGLQAFLLPISFNFSPLSLLMLTVDRYISVVHALRYPSLVTVKRARIAVMSVFAALLLISIGFGFVGEWYFSYSSTLLSCASLRRTFFYLEFMQVIYYCTIFSALLTILITYIRLFLIARHHQQRIHADNPAALEGNPPHQRPNNKMLYTLLIVALSAFVSVLLPVLWFILGHLDHTGTFFMLVLPILTNSWLNVVIYFFRNKDIRQATRNLLRTYFTSLQQHFPCSS
ncbi:beta-3 adrenergic receptor-like [Patiria miniata]|uniref:G-protein coupled receptors family 1 profile domain-containing protein n=1 Tax=Patiria miniata TaxID=46514 RepID=A0A914BB78_PATMI|nr:beta-3 adrenergic receptor-like [Patiria miniata]